MRVIMQLSMMSSMGKYGKTFNSIMVSPFLSAPFTYGLMLNIDWFKPCKHTEYSVGAMYLTFMNLPRTMRFRQENVLLIGLIAGPSEPETDINPFLAFPGNIGQKDYSGCNRGQWKERNLDEHRKNVSAIRQCKTKTARNNLESKYGCRYSALLDLPCFDPIRMMIIILILCKTYI